MYIYYSLFILVVLQGCEITDIIEYSQNILEFVISHLCDITILCDENYLIKQDINNKSNLLQRSESSFHQSKMHSFNKYSKNCGISKKSSNIIPIGIQYSSRHFSPSQSYCTVEKQEIVTAKPDEEIFEKNCFENYELTETLKCSLLSLIKKLDHGGFEFINLIHETWTNQVVTSNSVK